MAVTIPVKSAQTCSVDDLVEFVEGNVQLDDLDSLATCAPLLRALANDRMLIVRKVNLLVESAFQTGELDSAQSLVLGRGKDFFVRANLWPSTSDLATGRVYQDHFSYNIPHDHNFSFVTVGYSGPGYLTDIYEYDHETVVGEVGESVDLRFLEKVQFSSGMAMMYRARRDVHVQYPSEQLTVTLNLIASPPETRFTDQFTFDLNRGVITGIPTPLEASKRSGFVRLVSELAGDQCKDALQHIAESHPCRRTRLAAFQSLSSRTPGSAGAVWERAAADAAPLVSREAMRQLETLKAN